MKMKKSLLSGFLIIAMLIPYFTQLLTILPLGAEAAETSIQLVKTDELVVTADYHENENAASGWQLHYEKKPGENQTQRLKFKLGEQKVFADQDNWQMENDWFVETVFGGTAVGELFIPAEATEQIQVSVQLDATTPQAADTTNTTEEIVALAATADPLVTENILNETVSGPHVLGPDESVTPETTETTESITEITEMPTTEATTEAAEGTMGTTEAVVEEATETIEAASDTGQENSTDSETLIDNSLGLIDSTGGFSILNGSRSSRAFGVDPFKYYDATNSNGVYPKHGTNQYLPGTNNTSETIKNYNYGSTITAADAEDGVELYSISSSDLNFENGYHEYGSSGSGRLNTKKTVSPTNDPNVFQVQLDTIGDAIRPIPKVDVVLVLDKSSSMNNKISDSNKTTRWSQLKAAVNKFADDLLANSNTHDVQIGMAAFGSYQKTYGSGKDKKEDVNNPYGEIASFSDLGTSGSIPTSMTGFTKNATTLKNHTMISENSAPTNSGTPTFLGIDAGLKLLTTESYGARLDAKKVIITITDGTPTFYPQGNYFSTDENTKLDTSLNLLSKSRETGNVLRMTAVGSTAGQSNLVGGTGGGDNSDENIPFINARYNQFSNLNRYSVGFHTGEEVNSVIKALGPDGAYKATAVDSLIQALSTAISELIATVYNAVLYDPMSEYVTLDTNSITSYALSLSLESNTLTTIASTATNYPDYAKVITTSTDGGDIKLEGINLGLDSVGNRQGYRITYKVTLNEAYRDGTFYPANEMTYLANGDGNYKNYAVPSVKAALPKVNFTLKKVAAGTNIGLAGAEFQLFNQKTGGEAQSAAVTSDANGSLNFTNITPGTYWLRETKTPDGFQTMESIQITITHDGKVSGAGINKNKIENTLKEIVLTLNKKDAANEPLSGATFVLKKGNQTYQLTANGSAHTLANLGSGTYEVIETGAPAGYQVLGEIGTLTISDTGDITFAPSSGVSGTKFEVDKLGEKIQITMDATNELKPFQLTLTKRSAQDHEQFLAGAVFTLYDRDPADSSAEELATLTTDDNGTGKFMNGTSEYLLMAGKEYYLKETEAPDGFHQLTGTFTLIIGTDGSASLKYGEKAYNEGFDLSLTEGEGNNQLSFAVDNTPKSPLPKTGGQGRGIFFISAMVLLAMTGWYFYKKETDTEKGGRTS